MENSPGLSPKQIIAAEATAAGASLAEAATAAGVALRNGVAVAGRSGVPGGGSDVG